MESIIQNIRCKLSEMESAHDCRVLFAVESGSRAWGYASESSDYDVRCVFCRPLSGYLRVFPLRDTIEWELNDVYDINGWDLQKALRLALRSNISVFEWADSPMVYRATPWMDEFRALTRAVMQPSRLAAAYLGIAESMYKRFFSRPEPPYKAYFYAVRSLLAARWVLQEQAPAPVPFAVLSEALLPAALQPAIQELLLLRSSGAEKAAGPLCVPVADFITREMACIRAYLAGLATSDAPDPAPLDDFFRRVVGKLD